MPAPARVAFLLFSVDGVGGIARTVVNLANRLADTYDVELISLHRHKARSAYAVDDRITVSYLHDARPVESGQRVDGQVRAKDARADQGRLRAFLDGRTSRLAPPEAAPDISRLTDLLLRRKLRSMPPGILVSTRPSLHAAAARYAPRHLITVAQDHLNFESRSRTPALLEVIERSAPKLDCFVALTDADREDYARLLAGSGTAVVCIPNAAPWPIGESSTLDGKVVVAAGRLAARKGFPRLVRAYAPIARAHPDWQLHIYGNGPERSALRRLISNRDLGSQIVLRSHSDDIESVYLSSAVFALSSHAEGFSMVLIEAMSKGLPVVSFDIPRGPAEVIRDGHNGRLVKDGDLAGFTAALAQIIEDDDLRHQMGAAALATAKEYDTDTIAGRWVALFDRLQLDRGAT
jgi:glycosyltransferase involved in cell wall biosynthesis